MDCNLFWTAFGAIGSIVGALLVAIWQNKKSQMKKITITLSNNLFGMKGNTTYGFVELKIVNTGNRDIVIDSIGFKTEKKEVLFSNRICFNPISCSALRFPHALKPEESIVHHCAYSSFKEQVKELIDSKSVNPSRRLRVFIKDSTGKEYIVKTPETAKQYVSEND